MEALWTKATNWFFGLGEQYGVDPIIFGTIYVGAIPFFFLSVAWMVSSKRNGKPLTFPILAAGLCFISSYLYLFIAGENIPWWVYGAVIGLVLYGGYSSYRSVRSKLEKA